MNCCLVRVVLAKVREMVLPTIEKDGPIEAWIIDDTSFPKQGYCSRKRTRRFATSSTSFIVQEAMKVSPKISNFPDERWKNIGRAVTTMPAARSRNLK